VASLEAVERPAAQSHFNDLSRMLGHPTPAKADPEGVSEAELKKRTLTNLYNQRPTSPTRNSMKPSSTPMPGPRHHQRRHPRTLARSEPCEGCQLGEGNMTMPVQRGQDRCSECKTLLPDEGPCPNCGSTKRTVPLTVHTTVTVEATVDRKLIISWQEVDRLFSEKEYAAALLVAAVNVEFVLEGGLTGLPPPPKSHRKKRSAWGKAGKKAGKKSGARLRATLFPSISPRGVRSPAIQH
jgi:hypothetical protein